MYPPVKCPKCNSNNLQTYRHMNARVWCNDCGFVVRDEGSSTINRWCPEDPVLTDLKRLLEASGDVTMFREGTSHYRSALLIIEEIRRKYKGK